MKYLRMNNILGILDYKIFVVLILSAVLFLIYENSTHNISLEDCEQCKGNQ